MLGAVFVAYLASLRVPRAFAAVIVIWLRQAPLYSHPLPPHLLVPLLQPPSRSSPWLRLSWLLCQRWLSLVERVSLRRSSFSRGLGAAIFAVLASSASFLFFTVAIEVHQLVSISALQVHLP